MIATDEIKNAIARLHDRNSNDFQSLLKQVEEHHRRINLNMPQLIATLSTAPTLVLEWGRGTGKTTLRGYRWSEIGKQMPRSTGLFIGPTYQAILTRIVPSLVQGLEMFGLYQNLHYFIGKKPPRSWQNAWPSAYQPPDKHDHYITFWNGMGVHLISHDVKGDGRGLNSDWIDADEAALLSGKQLQSDQRPTLRGTNKKAFKDSRFFGSQLYSSTTPLTSDGQWFIDYEEKAISNPKQITFISATSAQNSHNLMDGYLEKAKAEAYEEYVYLAEYENVRPSFTKDGFYYMFSKDIHTYTDYNYDHYTQATSIDCRGDADLIAGLPLIGGVDWGASINSLTINQYNQQQNIYRTLKSFYALGSEQKIQDDLFEDFDRYYHYHPTKTIYLWYDNSGNAKVGNVRYTRAEQAAAQLRARGWKVILMTVGGSNPSHAMKYELWAAIMKGDTPLLPSYRMNQANCKELYISMKNAKAIKGRDGLIHKDKRSEKSTRIQRQHATDLSDANDTPIVGMFSHILNQFGSTLPAVRVSAS